MKIINFSHVCIDHNIIDKIRYISAGSPAMFMAKVFKQLKNVDYQIVSNYGKDFLPYIKNHKTCPIKPLSSQTLIYQNKVIKGKRTQKALNRSQAKPVELNNGLIKELQNTDVIIFSPLLANYKYGYIKQVMKMINPKVIKVLLPQGYFRRFDKNNHCQFQEFKQAYKILSFFDFVILSDQDYPQPKKLIQSWLKLCDLNIILTLEDKGAQFFNRRQNKIIFTRPVKTADIVDSVGSGDIFSASFVYRYFQTKNLEQSIKFANKIARKCLFYTSSQLDEIKIS